MEPGEEIAEKIGFPSSLSLPSDTQDDFVSIVPESPEKKKWGFLRRKKNNSNTSVSSKKSLFSINRRKINKKRQVSGLFLPATNLGEHAVNSQLLAVTQRTKSLSSDGRRSRLADRVRSNSSAKTKGRKYRKKLELEERERQENRKRQMETLLQNLCSALAAKDKRRFVSLFSIKKAQICHPVGILKEYDIGQYFDNFVQVYSKINAKIDESSIIVDLKHLGIHCDVCVSTQYKNGNADYDEPQHWHFDLDVVPIDANSPFEEDHDAETLPRKPSRVRSKDSLDLMEVENPVFLKVVIKRWHVYSSLARYEVKNRSYRDFLNSSLTWFSYGKKYGREFVTSQLSAAFNTETQPPEVTALLGGLREFSVDKVLKCISGSLRAAVVEGIFSYYTAADANNKADVKELVQILLKQLDRFGMRQIKCESAFRCGDRISARLSITARREHICGFLLLRMTGTKRTSGTNKIKEILLCTENI